MEVKKIRMATMKLSFWTLIPDNGKKCAFIIS